MNSIESLIGLWPINRASFNGLIQLQRAYEDITRMEKKANIDNLLITYLKRTIELLEDKIKNCILISEAIEQEAKLIESAQLSIRMDGFDASVEVYPDWDIYREAELKRLG